MLVASQVVAQPPAPGAAAGDCDRCGKIESIRPVTAKDTWTPLGTVSASPLGSGTGATPSGVTMYQIGPGFSKQGTVLIGAAGGAAYRTRPTELNAKRWEIVVRMDAGGAKSVNQNYEPMLREGDRVRVMGNQLELVQ
jgi:outer membrane lipoprotein SlyB